MELKTWGVLWHQEIPRSRDYRCPECGDGTFYKLTTDNIRKYIVGVDIDQCGSYKVIAIFRCPKCEKLFWFHLDLGFASWILESMEER